MPDIQLADNAVSTLDGGISDADLSLDVQSGDGAEFATLTGSQFSYVTIINDSNQFEIVKVTARAGDTMTITRAQGGTSARAFSDGARVECRMHAAAFQDLMDGFIDGEAAYRATANTTWGDNNEVRFGHDHDFGFFSDGTDFFLKKDPGGTPETILKANKDGSVEIYNDNTKAIEAGVSVDSYHSGTKRTETTATGLKLSQTNNVLDLNKGRLRIYKDAGGADHTVSGVILKETAGETLAYGDHLYRKASDGRLYKAVASSATTMPICAIALESKTAGQECDVLVWGIIRDESFTFPCSHRGDPAYASCVSGGVTSVSPSGSGSTVQVLGLVGHNHKFYLFNPSFDRIVVK